MKDFFSDVLTFSMPLLMVIGANIVRIICGGVL